MLAAIDFLKYILTHFLFGNLSIFYGICSIWTTKVDYLTQKTFTEISNVSKNVFLCIRYNKMYYRLRNALHYIDNISHDHKVLKQLNFSKKNDQHGARPKKPYVHYGIINLVILYTLTYTS